MTSKEANAVLAARLRRIADAIEALPHIDGESIYCGFRVWQPDTFKGLARAFSPFDKDVDQWSFAIKASDGSRVSLGIDRGKMCRKVLVTKQVEEFECDDSILDPTPEAAEVAS